MDDSFATLESALESRPAMSNPDGKRDRRLDLRITEDTESALIAMAAMRGMNKSEFANVILEEAMFGRFGIHQKIEDRRG